MTDLAKGLENWMKQIEKAGDLTAQERSEITGAGAEVYEKILRANTPRSDRNYSKKGRRAGRGKRLSNGKVRGRQHKHIADALTFKPGWTADGYLTGDTSVGWSDKYSAMVARFVNDGVLEPSAKELANMHFRDRADLKAKDDVLKAEIKKYKEVISRDRS